MTTTGERMSPVDRAWLLMDRPTNPMVVVAVIVLGGRLPLARLRRLIGERMLAFDRFRCRPESELLGAHWLRSGNFDIDDHVLGVALPATAGQRELEALVGELAGTPFNRVRPWWSFHLVERYGRGSAIIARIHHCYADGIALMQLLLGLADGARPRAPRKSRPLPPGDADAHRTTLLDALYEPIAGLLTDAWRAGTQAVERGARYALHPGAAAGLAAEAGGAVTELIRLAVLADDPPTALKGPLSGSRHVAWAPPLALDEVRALSHALDCTINDVLIATLAGALGGYLRAHRQRTTGLTLHAAVPVNLRGADDAAESLGNRFGLVFVELPVGERSPLERLFRVRDSMRALKGSAQAMMTYGLLAAVGSLPEAVEHTAIEAFTAKASLVASNVPGPSETIRIGGVAVRQLLFWVPQAGSIGTGVSLLSYRGEVQFGVMADRQLIAEPAELVAWFTGEFEQLVLLTSLLAPPLTSRITSQPGKPRRAIATAAIRRRRRPTAAR